MRWHQCSQKCFCRVKMAPQPSEGSGSSRGAASATVGMGDVRECEAHRKGGGLFSGFKSCDACRTKASARIKKNRKRKSAEKQRDADDEVTYFFSYPALSHLQLPVPSFLSFVCSFNAVKWARLPAEKQYDAFRKRPHFVLNGTKFTNIFQDSLARHTYARKWEKKTWTKYTQKEHNNLVEEFCTMENTRRMNQVLIGDFEVVRLFFRCLKKISMSDKSQERLKKLVKYSK